MTGWQSIETAPKDGTRILLWGSEDVYIGLWWTPYGYWAIDNGDSFDHEPTHWCPIPPPPGEAKP